VFVYIDRDTARVITILGSGRDVVLEAAKRLARQ
jgi:hypothetical protein